MISRINLREERRKQIQEEEAQLNELYDEWMAKDKMTQIKELKEGKEQERKIEDDRQLKIEEVRTRKKLWKDWRKCIDEGEGEDVLPEVDEDVVDNEVEDDEAGQVHHPREAVGEPPGQGNSPHKAGVLLAKLGEEEPGWGGGV